ncbi:hypothetical protein Hanom_Chr10g00892921 [Helianthus anomalus]
MCIHTPPKEYIFGFCIHYIKLYTEAKGINLHLLFYFLKRKFPSRFYIQLS